MGQKHKTGNFKVISEDSGHELIEYKLSTGDGTFLLNAKGEIGEMSKKEQEGRIFIYPVVTTRIRNYKFKGVELVPID